MLCLGVHKIDSGLIIINYLLKGNLKQVGLTHMHILFILPIISCFLIILNHSMVHAERTSILHLHSSQTPSGL